MRLNDNTVSLAVDSNAVQPLRDRCIRVSIDVAESLFIVDYHGAPVDREYTSREDVWGKSNELNAGCENLVVGGDGGAEEEVFKRNVDAIAGDSGSGIGASDVVCKGEGQICEDCRGLGCGDCGGRGGGNEAEGEGSEGMHFDCGCGLMWSFIDWLEKMEYWKNCVVVEE